MPVGFPERVVLVRKRLFMRAVVIVRLFFLSPPFLLMAYSFWGGFYILFSCLNYVEFVPVGAYSSHNEVLRVVERPCTVIFDHNLSLHEMYHSMAVVFLKWSLPT